MNNDLPITLTVDTPLSTTHPCLSSVVNKLEALINFRAMAALWFENEATIISMKLLITSIDDFSKSIDEQPVCGERTDIADDVVSFYDDSNQLVCSIIGITVDEESLLKQHPALLAPMINKKCIKVINILASQMGLTNIVL